MLEDTPGFTLEGVAPFIDLSNSMVERLPLESTESVLIYSYGGSEEVVESCRRNPDEIIRSNRGRPVEDKQVIDAYWRSKTGLRGLPSISDATS